MIFKKNCSMRLIFCFVGYSLVFGLNCKSQLKHYYCTAADKKFYDRLKNLIGSIHQFDFENLSEIAVFDLGLKSEQRAELKKMQKVSLHEVEITHPDILKEFVISPGKRRTIGHFAWKPVVIKQALELFPYVLYLDAGVTVLKQLDDLFDCINQRGYFFLVIPDFTYKGIKNWVSVENRATKRVIQTLLNDVNNEQRMAILRKANIVAGVQGLTRALLNDYVLPLYQNSYDISLFEDDGSAPLGWGEARHDQILSSIYVHRIGYILNELGWSTIEISTGNKHVHVHHLLNETNKDTVILLSSALDCKKSIRFR